MRQSRTYFLVGMAGSVATSLLLLCSAPVGISAFRATPITLSRKTAFLASPAKYTKQQHVLRRSTTSSSTGLNMFMGSDGGLLGVGTPELFTILLVGYFVLGPSDLFKLTKEIGKFVQNIRTLGNDLTTTLESNMENQLQLEELRKAQRELNDAFSFRRSINTDVDESEAFSTTVTTPRPATAQDEMAASVTAADGTSGGGGAAAAASKKKIRRRVKRKPAAEPDSANGAIPDLEMPAATMSSNAKSDGDDATAAKYANRPSDPFIEYTPEEQALIDQEFDKYTSVDNFDDIKPKSSSSSSSGSDNWYESERESKETEKSTTRSTAAAATVDPKVEAATQSRFQQQLSGKWNDQVMANEDKLGPLAKVMEMLAVLEEEKVASTKRLEEEFRQRAEMEEAYYQKQRKLLEEAASQVQTDAYQQQKS